MLTPEEIEDYGWRLTGGAEAVLMAEVLDLLVSRFAMVFSLDIEDVIALNAVAAVGGDLEAALSALIARYNPVVKAEAVALTYELLERGDALEATRLSREFGKAARPLTEQAMQAAVGVAQIVGRDNVSMGQLAEQAWWKACTRVTLGCVSGEKSLDELIAEGVGYLAEKGVSAVTYVDDAGNVTRTDSVDVAVRRHAITQANQAGGRMTIQRMQEFGHDLVQTTAHMGARPTHEPWQGRAFSLSGPREVDGVTYPNFYEETGYGTVSGLQGANCRHTFYSYFPGDPLPERPDPEENAERYRAEQKQRRIEREIRRCKRDIAADEAALETLSGPERTGAVEERLARKKARLKGLQAKMREHVGGHDYLVRQPKREKDYMGRIEKHEAKEEMDRRADTRYTLSSIQTREGFKTSNWQYVREHGAVYDEHGRLVAGPFEGELGTGKVSMDVPPGFDWKDKRVVHTHPGKFGGIFSVGKIVIDEHGEEYAEGDLFHLLAADLLSIEAVCNEGIYRIERTRPTTPEERAEFLKLAQDEEYSCCIDARVEVDLRWLDERRKIESMEDKAEFEEEVRRVQSKRMHNWLGPAARSHGYSYTFTPRV